MSVEYKTITVAADIDDALNAEAADGWRVHTVTGAGEFLMERKASRETPITQAGSMPTGPRKPL